MRRNEVNTDSGHVDPEQCGSKPPASNKLRLDSKTPALSKKWKQENNKSNNKLKTASMKMNKSKLHSEKTGIKLENARKKLAKQKHIKRPGVAKTVINATGFEVWTNVHHKVHEAEHDNSALEVLHKTELLTEDAARTTARTIKRRYRTRPARRVRKMEKKNIRANADYRFHQMAQENPEMKKGRINKFIQKRRLRKQYNKQAHKAAKNTVSGAAKKTGEAAASVFDKAAKSFARFAKKHPAGIALGLAGFFLIYILHSCVGVMATVGNGLGGAISANTYPSDDNDMLAAEAAYAAMESALQGELDNYPANHPGYDEYRYDFEDIEHDPYVLISILSVWHEGAWKIDEVQGTMSALFGMQYTLTAETITETRYRIKTSSFTDPETGELYTVSIREAYTYNIQVVCLTNFDMSHLPVYFMDEVQLSRYSQYMATLGNRPDLFPNSIYPFASTTLEYLRYPIPPEYMNDEMFAAMIKEAEKYLGYPYVWGGSKPYTSFDCSGFVSWVVNHSGWDLGRLTAQGLFEACVPVSPGNAKPGDLIFFKGTYKTAYVSHVGIYVGDNMMLHCGNPISYASTATPYWINHFYCYGRLS